MAEKRNVISTFSGAMGLENGLERAGLNVKLCIEIEHAMTETIRLNKPLLPLVEDDIRNYSGNGLSAKACRVSVSAESGDLKEKKLTHGCAPGRRWINDESFFTGADNLCPRAGAILPKTKDFKI